MQLNDKGRNNRMNDKQEISRLAQFYALDKEDQALRDDVRLLGALLGETIRQQHGLPLYQLVEEIRQLAKDARQGDEVDISKLMARLDRLDTSEMVILARAFALFLNLANIAEQHHQVRQRRSLAASPADGDTKKSPPTFLEAGFDKLISEGVTPERLLEHVNKLSIELVLTAHPTEIVRRSVSSKFLRISKLLYQRDKPDLSRVERRQNELALHRAIAEVWETDEIRRLRPTPVDEAKNGLIAVEQTLWDAVPLALRQFDQALEHAIGERLPLSAVPVRFGSWMGGDRDGNPNTTPAVTREVCLMSRLRAAKLFYREIDQLRQDLSMTTCSSGLAEKIGGKSPEPYRVLLRGMKKKLRNTIKMYTRAIEQLAAGKKPSHFTEIKNVYTRSAEIREPLMLCYESLVETGNQMIADGRLSDIIRRIDCFGLVLLKLDIRQEADRHAEAIDTITKHLGMGSYLEWNEEQKQQFLIKELQSKRPLIASTFPSREEASDEVREVLETFRMLAAENPESLGTYVISMAGDPSDVLEVALLQKECRVKNMLPIAPLFERLDDLDKAPDCMDRLFGIPWYKEHIQGRQEVMIGYSDSAKDAGKMAASWGLYRAQESLVEVFERHDIHLTLFHGRGGTVARGGGPAYEAIRAQPPGSVNCSMRVTEQGEVIQAKFGLPGMALETLEVYIGSVLEATLAPPPKPEENWRQCVDSLAEDSVNEFRQIVRDHPQFVPYFRMATPEQELGNLKIGSRPARRKPGGGIETLRAIPWIFAWTQTRLMLPAWLGVGAGLQSAFDRNQQDLLDEMQENWPFFSATMDSIEMVFSKADPHVSAIYDAKLVSDDLKELGNTLRDKFKQTMDLTLKVTKHTIPLQTQPVVRRSVEVRNTYVDPLNLLQVELLSRVRETQDDAALDALLIAINGIAAGMRNTG